MPDLSPKFDTCFFERYAQLSLATLLGEPYTHLVNRDRPDLQDKEHGIGIEVTRAIAENKNVAHALINEMAGREVMEVRPVDLDNIYQSGYAYGLGDGNMMGQKEYEYWSLALPMRRIIKSKINKVNNGFYGHYNEFGLFVFTKELLYEDEIQHIMDFAMETQAELTTRYDKLFVSQIQTLFVCDLHANQFEALKVSMKQRKAFYENAIGS